MTDTLALNLIVSVFWIAFWVMCLILRHTVIPMIPTYPAVLFGLGWLLNALYPWGGTTTIAAIHVALLAGMTKNALRRPLGEARTKP